MQHVIIDCGGDRLGVSVIVDLQRYAGVHHTATHRPATRCNILQQRAEAVNSALDPQRHTGVQHSATHCNTLTYIALQHTITHYNTHCNRVRRQ